MYVHAHTYTHINRLHFPPKKRPKEKSEAFYSKFYCWVLTVAHKIGIDDLKAIHGEETKKLLQILSLFI